MNIGASHTPIIAENTQKSRRQVEVDIFAIRVGSIHAIASITMNMPQNTSWLPKMNCMAAALDATPSAQNAEIRRPMNMRT